MMKKIKIIFLTILIFLSFCKNKNENIDPETKKRIEFVKKVKERTERDLKKYGIKKILLSGDRIWDFAGVISYEFKENGRIYMSAHAEDKGYFYWKVENNKLYINPNNIRFKENKFILMKVEAIEPGAYQINSMEYYKYALKIESEDKRIGYFITLGSKDKVVD